MIGVINSIKFIKEYILSTIYPILKEIEIGKVKNKFFKIILNLGKLGWPGLVTKVGA